MTGQITTPPWAKPKPAKAAPHTIDPLIRRKVWQRAAGACELCGERLPALWDCHHRKLRSRGGDDSVVNLLALCPRDHRRAHAHPSWATEQGFMVASTDDPGTVAVAIQCSSWRLLSPAGSYIDAETGAVR